MILIPHGNILECVCEKKRNVYPSPVFGRDKTIADLGQMIRAFRKSSGHTLETLSDLSNLGIRFLSELEPGKETAEIGKALRVIEKLGLEVII